MANFTSKWTGDIVFRDNDSACNDLCFAKVIGGVEKNPGPVVEAEKILYDFYSGCDRNLK